MATDIPPRLTQWFEAAEDYNQCLGYKKTDTPFYFIVFTIDDVASNVVKKRFVAKIFVDPTDAEYIPDPMTTEEQVCSFIMHAVNRAHGMLFDVDDLPHTLPVEHAVRHHSVYSLPSHIVQNPLWKEYPCTDKRGYIVFAYNPRAVKTFQALYEVLHAHPWIGAQVVLCHGKEKYITVMRKLSYGHTCEKIEKDAAKYKLKSEIDTEFGKPLPESFWQGAPDGFF